MNCQNHPEVPATAYCRNCGKPVCEQCRRDAFGTVYCEEHAPAPAGRAAEPSGLPPPPPPPPFTAPPPFAGPPPVAAPPATGYVYADVSPGLALFLGMIPGVGAIYNGQYAKGIVHAVIWGVLMSIADSRAAHGAGTAVRDVGGGLDGCTWPSRPITRRASAGWANRWTSIPAL